jgi:exoribonuclease-2
MNTNEKRHRSILQNIARKAMFERGLLPDFSAAALTELDEIQASAGRYSGQARDQRELLWCSIDNDDSRDLDQLTVAESMPNGNVKVMVAIADVAALVKDGSTLDQHARHNTTSVYTAAELFPMLPEKLSTDLTSLNIDQDRLAVVVEMEIDGDGALLGSEIYTARVRNHAKLAYNSIAA